MSRLSSTTRMSKRKQETKSESLTMHLDMKAQRMELKSILKDIEYMGPQHMTWKQKKELENRKVVSLGGKPPKKQRLPLSVARVTMKKQKEREQKMLQENLMLGRVGGKLESGSKREFERQKPEDRVLKSTVGQFRNGVLDVKHLLRPTASRDNSDTGSHGVDKGKKKKGGKRKQGKKRSGGRKR